MKNPEDRPLEIFFLDSDDAKTGLLEQGAQVQQARHLKGVGLKADVKNVDVLAVLDPARMNAAEEVFANSVGTEIQAIPPGCRTRNASTATAFGSGTCWK